MGFEAHTIYEKYLARAKDVVSGAPYWKVIASGDFARLTVDGAEATLSWPGIGSGNPASRETVTVSFPAAYLTLREQTFRVWKAEEKEKYYRREEERMRVARERDGDRDMYSPLNKTFR